MWHGYWSVGDWVWMSLVMVVFWSLVVAGTVWLVRGRHGSDRPTDRQGSATSPQQLLDERYARGELSDEEYLHRRDLLASR